MQITSLTTAVIAFAAGVVVASLNAVYSRKNERRKHVAELASAAFVDMAKAQAENAISLTTLNNSALTDDERARLTSKVIESLIDFASAKARFAAYGNSKAVSLMAAIENQGGFVSSDSIVQELFTKVVAELRPELELGRNVPESDIQALLFGGQPQGT